MLETMKTLLSEAEKTGKALPAINVSNMESLLALLDAAESNDYPVIIQVSPIELDHKGISFFEYAEMVKLFLGRYQVDAAIHLDHATTVEQCLMAMQGGFTSVMFDGSSLPFEENLRKSAEVANLAKKWGATVEAELGKVSGNEGEKGSSDKGYMTDPGLARSFVTATGIDCLAVAIGNAHGLHTTSPKLDFERLLTISKEAGVPLVLHGGTGIPAEDIRKAISRGIRKINFFTEIDRSFVAGFTEALQENPSAYLMEAAKAGQERMQEEIERKIELCRR